MKVKKIMESGVAKPSHFQYIRAAFGITEDQFYDEFRQETVSDLKLTVD